MVVLTEILQESSSSSSSNPNHTYRYDVFLSFRGADTRNGFTSHLYEALLNAGIVTFYDDEEIETGESLKPELESAIESSRAFIIVLSDNYASSTWCLDELVSILAQNKNFNQIVIPIFYHVEPTHIRKQQSSFGEAMAKHKRRMEEETIAEKRSEWGRKIELWKIALTQVADLKGKDVKDRKETEIINEVVTDIHHRLGVLLSSTLPSLVGMEDDIKFITSWLTDESCHTASILTIVGMSGIGKTCLARYVFGLHSGRFRKSSFLEGIAGCNQRLLDLQKQLHEDISKKAPLQVINVSVYTSMIEKALDREMVFVVLDDIDSLDQLNALLGNKRLHPGSKVIITTKDASLTERCALFNPQAQPMHTKVSLKGLSDTESLELLCIHAFKSKWPKEGYYEVLNKLVKYCEGHPLALEVLGKFLHKRDVAYWKDSIEVLKKEPHFRINQALKMSFDSLPFENDKELFKHIACFFVGMDRDVTETILNACNIQTVSGITNLIDRCLLSISRNKLMMHQLVKEMGRDLVHQESPENPCERSRLWSHEESFNMLKQEKGGGKLLGIALDLSMFDKQKLSSWLQLNTNALSKMDNLELLQLNYVKMTGSFKNISKKLKWLCMHGFHSNSIPSELPMENLVVLDMSHSNIKSFNMSYSSSQRFVSRIKGLTVSSSKEKRLLGSLKILDLSFCHQLRNLGGFFEFSKLERLIVKSCIRLIEVCESIEQCVELVHIDLSYCHELKMLPKSIGKLKKVKTLLLDGCSFHEPQIKMCDMNSSDIKINSQTSSSTIMKTIPRDKKFFTISLPSSLRMLSLANNNLSNESFPGDFSCLAMLEELCLDDNPIVSMPNCVRNLHRLKKLSMNYCDKVVSIEHPPCTLEVLSFACVNTSLRKIKFHREMSPLDISCAWSLSSPWSSEVEGMIKIQPLGDVEEKILHRLGWINLEFIIDRRLEVSTLREGSQESQTQMYYEFGIFSTIFEGCGMPDWIICRSNCRSISFTVPSSPKKLRGLNICYVVSNMFGKYITLQEIKVRNITQGQTWYYHHYIGGVRCYGGFMSLLSHWMFGPNEMKAGDHITIAMRQNQDCNDDQVREQCGIGLVYEDDDVKIDEEEEDVLSYYKSWNHIIGGDLSDFQLTTGEYLLYNGEFTRIRSKTHGRYLPTGGFEGRCVERFFTSKKIRAWRSESHWILSSSRLPDIDGAVEIQPLEDVAENVLNSLGWTNLEFIKTRSLGAYPLREISHEFQTQMYYEFGIFSTIYKGGHMPDWISCRSQGPSISFTIPSSPKKLRGLNLCIVVSSFFNEDLKLPRIKIINITKHQTWCYYHYIKNEKVLVDASSLTFLSHWMFGPNEMEVGDLITIVLGETSYFRAYFSKDEDEDEEDEDEDEDEDGDGDGDETKCGNFFKFNGLVYEIGTEYGISYVYDDDGKIEDEDVLGCYKSWNHIIGGDLSPYRLTTGRYKLDNEESTMSANKTHKGYDSSTDDLKESQERFKTKDVSFKAFSH